VSETTTREERLDGAYRYGATSGAGAFRYRTLPPSSGERWVLLSLLAIMFLGAMLRFYGLGFQSLSESELASWDLSNGGTLPQVIEGVRGDIHPPLYFLILRFAQWIFGDA
jgi:hypothetical protein